MNFQEDSLSCVRWILLDFDNTLMGTERLTVPLLIRRFNEQYKDKISFPLTIECFETHFQGKTRESLCDHLSNYFKIKVDCEVLYYEREIEIARSFQENLVEMAFYVIEALTIVRQRYKLALVTNSPLQRVFSAMRWAKNGRGKNLAKIFETSFFESGNSPKPLPNVYFFAMNQLRVLPVHCIAVEDSVAGAAASIRSGIKTFGYTGFSYNRLCSEERLKAAGVVQCFDDWRQFVHLI
ncbi:HAD family hydrolase [Holospora undulata]|uniref:Phosphorylated carbohydrates phosphatase n=1 Tax=Holospora undulata HU1 TaxID=1321371 RepID=A0A061JIK1_9PROT|nr:HAD family phosphatase [Holospora undulata]ETZ05418.1 phosphorylated carbohydrates phosphatase [Holospora undulata HU1]